MAETMPKVQEKVSTLEVNTTALPEHDGFSGLEVHEPVMAEVYQYRLENGEWEQPKSPKRTFSRKWLFVGAIIALIVIGGIVGGAVGGIMAHHNASKQNIALPASDYPSSSSTAEPSSNPSSVTPSSTSLPQVPNSLYINTSIAATTLFNGDRMIYFQDAAGFIREAQYNAATKSWTASRASVVATDAKNGTALSADSAYVLKFEKNTTPPPAALNTFSHRGVAYALKGESTGARLRLIGADQYSEWSDFQHDNMLGCSSSSSLSFVISLHTNRTDLESEGQDYKYDFFCMLDGKDRKFNWFTFNGSDPDPMSVPDQLSFSGSEIIDEKGIPFIPFVFMYPDATKSSNTNMDVLAMSSWKDSCGDDVCSYYPNETPSFSNVLQGGDIAVQTLENNQQRLFYMNSKQSVYTSVGSLKGSKVVYDTAVSMNLQLQFPHFAATASRSGNTELEENYFYFQQNGTHLAEIQYSGSSWSTTPTYILIQ